MLNAMCIGYYDLSMQPLYCSKFEDKYPLTGLIKSNLSEFAIPLSWRHQDVPVPACCLKSKLAGS